ncbi:hypothetical protein DFH08DRAFT_868110, partial [Mycena albidolilacea]
TANLDRLCFMYLLSFCLHTPVSHENGTSCSLMYLPSFPHTTTSIHALLGFCAPLSEFLLHNKLSTSWIRITASWAQSRADSLFLMYLSQIDVFKPILNFLGFYSNGKFPHLG